MWVPLSFHLYVVCVVYLVVCQELQVGYRGEWGRGEGSDMHVFVHVCIWMSYCSVAFMPAHLSLCVCACARGVGQALSQDTWIRPFDQRLDCTCLPTPQAHRAFVEHLAGPP